MKKVKNQQVDNPPPTKHKRMESGKGLLLQDVSVENEESKVFISQQNNTQTFYTH